MRRAVLTISYEILSELLSLPDGHEVVEVASGLDDRTVRVCRVVIRGPSLPEVDEGQLIPKATLIGRRIEAEIRVDDDESSRDLSESPCKCGHGKPDHDYGGSYRCALCVCPVFREAF